MTGTWLPETCREQKKNIGLHEKELCVKLVIYKDYTEMHGQQNIKFCKAHFFVYQISIEVLRVSG